MKSVHALLICASFAANCDAVPNLYVVEASVSDGNDAGHEIGADASAEAAPDASGACGVSCPDCPPNPGTCCPSGIPCLGNNCAVDCATCSGCAPTDVCCSKQGGQPVCRSLDAGKCPP